MNKLHFLVAIQMFSSNIRTDINLICLTTFGRGESGVGLRGRVLDSKHVGVRSRATELPCLHDVIDMNIFFKMVSIQELVKMFT